MKNNVIKAELNVNDNLIGIMRVGNIDYISLTDLAKYKNPNNPADVINKWLTNKDSFDFYSLWEELFNENFNLAESREIKINEVGYKLLLCRLLNGRKEQIQSALFQVVEDIVREHMHILI